MQTKARKMIYGMFRFFLLFCLLVPQVVAAQSILPASHGHHTVSFVISNTSVPLPVGTEVKFFSKTNSSAPKDIYVRGLVLGTKDNVTFFEVSEGDAVDLAHVRANQTVIFRQINEPDQQQVRERRRLQETKQVAYLAPSMLSVTVRVNVDAASVNALTPGQIVTFEDAYHYEFTRTHNGVTTTKSGTLDINAIFVNAKAAEDMTYDMTFVADPRIANRLMTANIQGTLSLGSPPPTASFLAPQTRAQCTLRTRRGSTVQLVPIPCG